MARVGPLERDGDIDRAVLQHLAVLKLNEDEARALAGGLDSDRLLRARRPEVVVTLGSEARGSSPRSWTRRSGRIASRRNPTGAGDAFSLVYLDGRARGLDPVAAGERASAEVAALLASA